MLGGLKNFQNVLSLGVELVHSYGYGFFQTLSSTLVGLQPWLVDCGRCLLTPTALDSLIDQSFWNALVADRLVANLVSSSLGVLVFLAVARTVWGRNILQVFDAVAVVWCVVSVVLLVFDHDYKLYQ